MCDSDNFNQWAESYDEDVDQSDQNDVFPFAGYKRVLERVGSLAGWREPRRLLDIGVGSGVLSARFYAAGWQITALDFSEEMLKQARLRMPRADFFHCDFSKELPPELTGKTFDVIVMTYAFHHLSHKQQPVFLRSLLQFLEPGGRILVGDIAFETQDAFEACRKRFPGEWDENEYYPILTELQAQLPDLQVKYEVISFCASVIQICPRG
jgi:putative AdoMet-dependent methyltransferase